MRAEARMWLKRLIQIPFRAIGLELVRRQRAEYRARAMPTWEERLRFAKGLGFSPRVVLDGGAFRGLWAKACASIFPGVQMILIEPNPFLREHILSNVSHIKPSPIVLQVALGESIGSASLNIWRGDDLDTGASLLPHVVGLARRVVEVEVDTIDAISRRLGLMPDLVKLDLQGAELSALRGGRQALSAAEFAIVEFGCLDAYLGRATPRQILDLLYDHDFTLYDIVDCHYRPYDGAMTGGDFFFAKNSSVLRRHKGWE